MKKSNRSALICGISGQDGSYLAEFLLKKKYTVYGTSRDAGASRFENLERLGIRNKVILISMMPEDFRSVLIAFTKSSADEVYFLAGQTSVGLSFELPVETITSISIGTLNILEASRMAKSQPKIYFAGSSEPFGDTNGLAANELTPLNPKSPYAVAKASAYWLVNNYRESYNMPVVTGILFNHESILRPKRFVTQKIISTVKRISEGSNEILELGNIDISRDWGWAPEYVEAMWLMLQQQEMEDFVISTGETNTLKDFVSEAFSFFDLDWKQYVKINKNYIRPSDILINQGDSSKALKKLNWKAKSNMHAIIRKMILNEHY
jgi:GDPmannose 4,6-dehydratase